MNLMTSLFADAPQLLWVAIVGYGVANIVLVGSAPGSAASACAAVVASVDSNCNDGCSCAFGLLAIKGLDHGYWLMFVNGLKNCCQIDRDGLVCLAGKLKMRCSVIDDFPPLY
ncbi:hypothetical protein Ancab_013898 [Ancistrocladus abbreviatus]